MATITRFPLFHHLRSTATSHVEHRVAGTVRRAGAGAAFWFRPLVSTISEVPINDREQELLVRVRTQDLQEITVPATVTYRCVRPDIAAGRVDFSIDPDTGEWQQRPLDTVGSMIHGAAATTVTTALSGFDLVPALLVDPAELGRTATALLAADPRLAEIGIAVVDVKFGVIRPEPDVERALQTPAREQVQQDADKATFERRAVAVEREAAIGENELANQIELARRQEQLIAQKGANARREAEDAAAADAVQVQALADRTTALADANAAAERAIGQARADAEHAKLAANADVPRDVLLALAVRELAANLPNVDQLVLTPDLLTTLATRLGLEQE